MDHIRFALRDETRELHDRLDELVGERALGSASDYSCFLTAHARVVLPLERWLEEGGVLRELADWKSRRRSTALRDDLRALSIAVPDGLPVEHEQSLGARAGVLYVLEGSRLGAAFLVSRARCDKARPMAFLTHGGGQHFWRTYLTWLESLELSAPAIEKACHAARGVFLMYLCAMTDHDRPALVRSV